MFDVCDKKHFEMFFILLKICTSISAASGRKLQLRLLYALFRLILAQGGAQLCRRVREGGGRATRSLLHTAMQLSKMFNFGLL